MDVDAIEILDQWLDSKVAPDYQAQPLAQHWARIAKVAEETGEAIQALIGWTGQNPRKGITNSVADVTDELADVVITGILAMQHFIHDADMVARLIDAKLDYQCKRAGLR